MNAPPPGRVAAVMVRALAAELSDPARFRRASAYARDGAVIDLVVEPGELRVLVRGSRFEPYQARVFVAVAAPGAVGLALVPRRDEVVAECTCPDDGPYASAFCKHALAGLLVLADRVTLEPDLLELWRADDDLARSPRPRRPLDELDDDEDDADETERIDVLAAAIAAPEPIPDLPRLPSRLPVAMARHDDDVSQLLADVLADAMSTLRSS
ncbi:MAG: hypothetical protein ACR2HP_05855 [Ilumatobacteraceae bacterium]